MKAFCTNRGIHVLLVALTLVSWLIVSNHCALGQLARMRAKDADHSCCHNGNAHGGQLPVDGDVPAHCCKSLHALVQVDASIGEPSFLAIATLLATPQWIDGAQREAVVRACDAGPPERSIRFSELVLQQSLPAHAPPFIG